MYNSINLIQLDCSENQINSLDITSNSALTVFSCHSNTPLNSLNIKNGNNTAITTFYANYNPNLSCIAVDNPSWSSANWTEVDSQTSFSDNCTNNDIDGDSILNENDICPNTPAGETVDANGCSSSQLDDDNDGVMNNLDLCPSTPTGVTVDANGCFYLPENNFNLLVTSETCPNKNNGQLVISANETHDYVASINATTYTFTTTKTITDLQPGNYTVCITVTGVTFEQCYNITIEEGTTVSGKSSVKQNKATIEMDRGTPPFKVFVNKNEVLNTNNLIFSVDVKHGDLLEVKTAKECEGIYLKAINLIDGIVAYPNPTNGKFGISLPNTLKEITIELYTIGSQLISKKTYPVYNGKVQLSLENQPSGVYVAKINMETPIHVNIIKQ
ncbi:T9SS type A sorting domain-containing protein [Lutibacter sp.]|uniref:T9SS type A sorting domain-containing protein n=1 Tax=Lutibacter sp. TaxID=1925666 RepID=UPI0025BA2431|nr:T9SS type A sorting domain-containing protein [Lutibacter sp.]